MISSIEAEDGELSTLRRSSIEKLLWKAYTGIEVYGHEWGFHFSDEEVTGVSQCVPRLCGGHFYQVTLEMGHSELSFEEVLELVERMKCSWRGPDAWRSAYVQSLLHLRISLRSQKKGGKEYNVVHNNCLDFADAFCLALGVGKLPRSSPARRERGGDLSAKAFQL